MENSVPTYKAVLTASGAIAELNNLEQSYFAAVSPEDPPQTATILYTTLEYPGRLKAQLRENLKRRNIQVIGQNEVTPDQLADIYASASTHQSSQFVDIDYERGRDHIHVLIAKAVQTSASDIHIVRRRRSATVSMRIDDQLVNHTEWSELEADRNCRFIYESMCQDQEVTWNRHEPQDAVLDTTLSNGQRVRVRVGTIPASPDGYDMVLRIMPGSANALKLLDLGYAQNQLNSIRTMIQRPSGLVIMAGSVGSGKSTSLVGMLLEELEMHEGKLRIITVEDPPERVIPGATQVPVVRRHGNTTEDEFAFAIRGALRCDPDTLMVGEIRDLQSAQLTIKFAQSGHRIYTTVHASTALGIVGRLSLIGVQERILCTPDVLKGLIYQSLVPLLCNRCKIETSEYKNLRTFSRHRRNLMHRASKVLEQRSFDVSQCAWRNSRGCSNCSNTGIKGRALIAEVIVPDDELLLRLGDKDYNAAKNHWLESLGGQPVYEHGLSLAANSKVSLDDLEWKIGSLAKIPAPPEKRRNNVKKF